MRFEQYLPSTIFLLLLLLSLESSNTQVCEPCIRALLGTASQCCELFFRLKTTTLSEDMPEDIDTLLFHALRAIILTGIGSAAKALE